LEAKYASVSRRVDRIEARIERIEKRLDLTMKQDMSDEAAWES
jgi:hypothetical protein